MLPTLGGTVSPDGELVLDKPRLYRRYLQTLIGEKVVLILRRPSEIRSLNQNAYYHSVVVALLAQEWGTTDREAHELIKRELGLGGFVARDVQFVLGHEVEEPLELLRRETAEGLDGCLSHAALAFW